MSNPCDVGHNIRTIEYLRPSTHKTRLSPRYSKQAQRLHLPMWQLLKQRNELKCAFAGETLGG
jgi:hypothetical protein